MVAVVTSSFSRQLLRSEPDQAITGHHAITGKAFTKECREPLMKG